MPKLSKKELRSNLDKTTNMKRFVQFLMLATLFLIGCQEKKQQPKEEKTNLNNKKINNYESVSIANNQVDLLPYRAVIISID